MARNHIHKIMSEVSQLNPTPFDKNHQQITEGENMPETQGTPEERQKDIEAHQHQFEDVNPGKNLLDPNVEPSLNDKADEKQKEEAEKDKVEHKKKGRKPKSKDEVSQPNPPAEEKE